MSDSGVRRTRIEGSAFFPFLLQRRADDGAIFGVGHDLGVVLLGERDGQRRLMRRDELEALGLDPLTTYLRTRDRLWALFRSGLLPWSTMTSATGAPCLVFHHPWLAASCMLLPGLFDLASRTLGTDELRLAVPRSDRLVVFGEAGPEERPRMTEWILRRIARSEIDLTANLFVLDVAGTSPLRAPRTTAGASLPSIEVEVDDLVPDSRGERAA